MSQRKDYIQIWKDRFKNRNGRTNHLTFTDYSLAPFGEYRARMLRTIPIAYYYDFVKYNDFARNPNETSTTHANKYQTIKGKFLTYAKRRIKHYEKTHKNLL